MDETKFQAELSELVKKYLGISDENGYICLQSLEIKIDKPQSRAIIKLSCVKVPN